MSVTPQVICLFGSSGFVGSRIVSALAGHQVVTPAAPRLITPARTLAEVLAEAEDISIELPDTAIVINAAGIAAPTARASDEMFGANALLPAAIALAAKRGERVTKFVHLSSAAVQGNAPVLTAEATWDPHSPYAVSKMLGERALLTIGLPGSVIHRATSVHGHGRSVTRTLARVARSPLASVASPGDAPTPQVHVDQVAAAVAYLAVSEESIPPITLQPWGGHTVSSVLTSLGHREPRRLPRWIAQVLTNIGRSGPVDRLSPRAAGHVRRLEMMWFGQGQQPGWLETAVPELAHVSTGWRDLGDQG